ncbi:hypothetical protein ACFQZC_08250 [Streptacidiphilus monticola]
MPLGILAHALIVPVTGHAGGIDFPASMRDVRHAGNVSAPLFCGVVLAVLGVLIPARSAGRLTIATVLHNE